MNHINRMKIEQLNRLLENSELNFDTAFMVIFSDYPSSSFISELLKENINFISKLNKTLAVKLIELV